MPVTPIQQIASDIAPELDRLLKDWLRSDMHIGSKERHALELYLWDNKVGMLRVLQAVDPSGRR